MRIEVCDVRRVIAKLKAEHGTDAAARMVGCDRKTLWRWESGQSAPSPLALRALERTVADAPKGGSR